MLRARKPFVSSVVLLISLEWHRLIMGPLVSPWVHRIPLSILSRRNIRIPEWNSSPPQRWISSLHAEEERITKIYKGNELQNYKIWTFSVSRAHRVRSSSTRCWTLSARSRRGVTAFRSLDFDRATEKEVHLDAVMKKDVIHRWQNSRQSGKR